MKNILVLLIGIFCLVNVHGQTTVQPKKNIRTDTIVAGQLKYMLDTNTVSYKMTVKNNGIMVSLNKTGNIVYTSDMKSGDVMLIEEITLMGKDGKMTKAPSRRLVRK